MVECFTGTGSKATRVTVYGPRGADDIGEYTGFTMIPNLL